MKMNRLLTGVIAFAAGGLTSAVIGRYGDILVNFLGTQVLLGFAVVATLVALIILEAGSEAPRQAAIIAGARRFRGGFAERRPAEIVPIWQFEEHKTT